MLRTDQLDEIYRRMYDTGPEFDGWLSNHGPMAADALSRIGHSDAVDRWLTGYLPRLEQRPAERWPIDADEWRGALGDHRRLGDWTAFFERAVEERPWRDVLAVWWPRLLPGAIAAATHGLIRTGHAVRALGEDDSPARRAEFAQGLGYWAARWQPLPDSAGLPTFTQAGVATADIPAALDDLVDTTVARYAERGRRQPVMLVHASTAPRAAALAIEALPRDLWIPTYQVARSVVLALTSSYAAETPAYLPDAESGMDQAELVAGIAAQGDSHGLKFTEVALESLARGNQTALVAIARALEWLAQ